MVADRPPDAVLFAEEQSFRQPWLWGLLLGVFVLVAASFGWGFVAEPEKFRSAWFAAVPFLLIWGGTILFLWLLKLSVRVDPQHLHIRFFPLMKKDIPLADIVRWEACTYRPIVEYGGWGVRYSLRKGWAYNVSGQQGVRLELVNGKQLLIGSQRAEELAAAIGRARAVNK